MHCLVLLLFCFMRFNEDIGKNGRVVFTTGTDCVSSSLLIIVRLQHGVELGASYAHTHD